MGHLKKIVIDKVTYLYEIVDGEYICYPILENGEPNFDEPFIYEGKK